MRVLPILFNTEIVLAILEGRKTCTRSFTSSDMDVIYQRLGNRVNHDRTIKFVACGCDVNMLHGVLDERGLLKCRK